MAKPDNEELLIEKEDDQSDEVFIEYDIATYPSDNTLKVLYEMWRNGDIKIPDFQRGFVWTIQQSSLLIESFLIGLPVPPVFFYIDRDNKNLVVDGQQRILSIAFFFEGYFGPENEKGKRQIFRLSGLNSRSPYYNKKFEDLDSSTKRKLENSVLRAINIKQLEPREESTSIYHIFERLNTGGTPLTAQEIRNVVFRGDFIDALKQLNENKNWRKILGNKTADKHQKDIELILRAVGISNYLNHYEKPMKEFLNMVASKNKLKISDNVKTFIERFPIATEVIAINLKSKPFHIRGPLNASAFDSIFSVIINHINELPKNLNERYLSLLNDPKFVDYTRLGTTDTRIVKDRYYYVENKLIY
uniref:DUF262 domain-containing protein n=1 Tax=Ignavibacterium album TaxID=591197 RepID=A0A7V3E6X2_9BACT